RGGVLGALVDLVAAAPIVLQIVDAPFCPGFGILFFVAIGGFIAGAGSGAGAGIDAEFEALGMDVIGQGLHIGKFFVREDVAVFIAAGHPGAIDRAALFPGVVDIDIDVSGVGHAANRLVIDAAGELVPTVPAHGRRFSETVGRDRLERREGRMRVGSVIDRVGADLLEDHGTGRTAASATAAT